MKDCLVIIDVQKGFLNDETKNVPEKIKNLLEKRKFINIVATRFINSTESPHYFFMHWDGMMDSETQEIHPYIETIAERIFDKDINSCFTEEFVKYIFEEKIEKLYFVGIETDCCVLKSAFDSFERKSSFEVIEECCASTGGSEIHEAACKIMRRALGKQCIK